jgi:hypothetical protein
VWTEGRWRCKSLTVPTTRLLQGKKTTILDEEKSFWMEIRYL